MHHRGVEFVVVVIPPRGIIALTDHQHTVVPIQRRVYGIGAVLHIGAHRVQPGKIVPESTGRHAAPHKHRRHRTAHGQHSQPPQPRAAAFGGGTPQHAQAGQHPAHIIRADVAIVILERQGFHLGKIIVIQKQMKQIKRGKGRRKGGKGYGHPAALPFLCTHKSRGVYQHQKRQHTHTGAQKPHAALGECRRHQLHKLGKGFGAANAQKLLCTAHKNARIAYACAAHAVFVNAGGSGHIFAPPHKARQHRQGQKRRRDQLLCQIFYGIFRLAGAEVQKDDAH